jgi:hypothetical protein
LVYYLPGISRSNIACLNADGSLDTSFNVGAGFDAAVYSIVLQADGKILVGGDFTSYNGITQNSITRLNADGSIDTSLIWEMGLQHPEGWHLSIQWLYRMTEKFL